MKNNKNNNKIFLWLIVELICVSLLVFAVTSLRKTAYGMPVAFVALIGILIGGKALGAYNGREISTALKKVFERLLSAAVAIANKLRRLFDMGTNSRHRGNIIRGYEDEISSVEERKAGKRRKRYKKWRDMDNKERVRFIFAKRMSKRIREGFEYEFSATPYENTERLVASSREEKDIYELTDTYNRARYDEGYVPEDDRVSFLRKSF